MFYSIFSQKISDRFTPGSPDCLLSTENTVKLRISLAFIKACAGSLVPCLMHENKPAIFRNQKASYRGAYDTAGIPCGRGILYIGSIFNPTMLFIGKFAPSNTFEEGYFYSKKDGITCHLGINKNVITTNTKGSDGSFSRGRLPRSTSSSDGAVSLKNPPPLNTLNPIPFLGGEINLSDKNLVLKGTIDTKGIFTGTIDDLIQNQTLTGIFSIKPGPQKMLYSQLSGTVIFKLPDGSRYIIDDITNKQVQGNQYSGIVDAKGEYTIYNCKKIDPDGSTCEGDFRFFADGRVEQISGSCSFRNEKISFVGRVIDETTMEGCLSELDGSRTAEGRFLLVNGSLGPQISGSLSLRKKNVSFVGRMVDETAIEGRFSAPDGSLYEGVFRLPLTTTVQPFTNQLSGTWEERPNENGEVVVKGKFLNSNSAERTTTFSTGYLKKVVQLLTESTIEKNNGTNLITRIEYQSGAVFQASEGQFAEFSSNSWFFSKSCEGSLQYPNGDYKTGWFSDFNFTREPCFLSGTLRKTYPDGRVFEGTDEGYIKEGTILHPDGRKEYTRNI